MTKIYLVSLVVKKVRISPEKPNLDKQLLH